MGCPRAPPSRCAMKRPIPRHLALPLALLAGASAVLAPSCAIVDSVAGGVRGIGRFARGIVRGEGQLEDGKQQGDWTYESENGVVRARGRYEDDVQVGVWTYYYENGQPEYQGELQGQRRTGRYQYWYPSGSPRAMGSFVDGREFGHWRFWAESGEISQRGTFWNGLRHGRWTSYHRDGTLASEGLYLEGQQVGRWRLRDRDGNESVAWTPLPEGYEWIDDRWEDGAPRRQGFRQLGRPVGLWVTGHRSGDPRLVCVMDGGVAQGHCVAFDGSRERVAEGEVYVGRPTGTWAIKRGAAMTELDAGGFPLAMPFQGEWSAAEVVRSAGPESTLGTWLSELAAPVTEEHIADHTRPADDAGAEALAAAKPADPDVPVMPQPWTAFELKNYDVLVKAYRKGGAALRTLQSRYARGRASAPPIPEPGGDVDAAAGFVGKPLPLTVFKNESGEDFDLGTLRGSKVVLVVLRGYPGQVCVYCTAQTQALCEEGAFEEFERLGARLQVLFPGEKNGLEAFKAAYDSLSKRAIPPYGLLYENDYIVGPLLNLEGSKVTPATFILDEEGIVRFAYIGKTREDRPAARLLIDELKKLGGPE